MLWVYMHVSVRSKLLTNVDFILLPVSHVLVIKRRFCSKILLLGIFKYQNSMFLRSVLQLFHVKWRANWRICKNCSTKSSCSQLLVTIQGRFRFNERNACGSTWFHFRFITIWFGKFLYLKTFSCFNCRFSSYNFWD